MPREEPTVEIFEWPDRFLVSADSPDNEFRKFWPGLVDHDPLAPHLVDLGELEEGWCGCRDFAVNVLPYLVNESHRTHCKHILSARRFKAKFTEPPIKTPPLII